MVQNAKEQRFSSITENQGGTLQQKSLFWVDVVRENPEQAIQQRRGSDVKWIIMVASLLCTKSP